MYKETEKKQIAILGSTGSIGTQALAVIDEHSDRYEANLLTAYQNVDLLVQQARKFNPDVVVIGNESCRSKTFRNCQYNGRIMV